MQLVVLRSTRDAAADIFVRLVTESDTSCSKDRALGDAGARYLVLNLVSAAEAKWPGIFE